MGITFDSDFFSNLLENENYSIVIMDYLNNDDFEKSFKNYCIDNLNKVLTDQVLYDEDKNAIFKFMTFIAMKYYDGSFWPHFRKICQLDTFNPNIVEHKFRENILKLYNSIYNDVQYYQMPVINSVVPYYYGEKYFDFVYDIFKKNFNCSIGHVNIHNEIELIFRSIKSKMNSNDDFFEFCDDSNKTKVYTLINSTKYLITHEDLWQGLIQFSCLTLMKISNYYHGKNIKTNDYIDNIFNKWSEKKEIKEDKKLFKNGNHQNSKNAYYSYLESNALIVLNSPDLKIYGEYDCTKFYIMYYDGVEKKYDKNLVIKKMFGGYYIESKKYIVKDPFNNINLQVLYDDDSNIIYNSRGELFRSFLLFGNDREITKEYRSYKGLCYVVFKDSCSNNVCQLHVKEKYKVGYIDSTGEDTIKIDSFEYSFVHSFTSCVFGEKSSEFKIIVNSKKIDVFYSISSLCLISKNADLDHLRVKINGLYHNLDSFDLINQKNDIAIILNDSSLIKEGLNEVVLENIYSNKNESSLVFYYDSSLEVEEYEVKDYIYNFTYYGLNSLIDNKGKTINGFNFTIANPNADKHYLLIDNNKYLINVELTMDYYYIDDEVPSPLSYPISRERISDINSKLYFKIKNANKVCFKDSNKRNIGLKINGNNDKYINVIDLRCINNAIYGLLEFYYDSTLLGKIEIGYIPRYNKKTSIEINDKKGLLIIKPVIDCLCKDEEAYVKVYNKYREKVKYIDLLNNKIIFNLHEMGIKNKNFNIKFYYKNLKSNKEETLYVLEKNIYDSRYYLNKYFVITQMNINNNGDLVKIPNYTIVLPVVMISEKIYECRLFIDRDNIPIEINPQSGYKFIICFNNFRTAKEYNEKYKIKINDYLIDCSLFLNDSYTGNKKYLVRYNGNTCQVEEAVINYSEGDRRWKRIQFNQ